MDMAGAVVAEHVDVKSVFGVFVVEPSFGEIASGFVSGCPILPVPKAKVGWNFVPLSKVEEKVRLVHTEITDFVIILLEEALSYT